MIEDLLTSALRTALQADVGNRVFHLAIPQNALLPACTYRLLAGDTVKTLDKSSQPSMRQDVYQIDLYAVDTATLRRMSRAVFGIEGYQTAQDVNRRMRWIWADDESEDHEPPRQMDEKGVRIASIKLVLWHDQG